MPVSGIALNWKEDHISPPKKKCDYWSRRAGFLNLKYWFSKSAGVTASIMLNNFIWLPMWGAKDRFIQPATWTSNTIH